MGRPMLDLELLRSFVSVVDSGGFTRAGERVHRTQSTVSQQIKRLEDDVGQPLLNRNGKDVTPTEAGERLLSYARRLLSLAEEARDVLARPGNEGAIKLGIPEDFAAYRLTKLLPTSSPARRGCRRRFGPEYCFRDGDPGRPSRAHRKGWFCADRQDGRGAGGFAGRQSRHAAAGRSSCGVLRHGAGEGGVALVLQRGRCTPLP